MAASTDAIPYGDETEVKVAVSEKRIKKVRSRLEQISIAIEEHFLEMSELLYEVSLGKYYLNWGYSDFEGYVLDEYGFKIRKAQYLVSVHKELIVDLSLKKDQLAEVGWSKAKELAGFVNQDNVQDWLKKAKELSYRKLLVEIKEQKNADVGKIQATNPELDEEEEVEEKAKSVSFKLFPAQKEHVEVALKIAGKKAGSEKKGHLLDLICSEFIAGNSGILAQMEKDALDSQGE